MRWARELSPHPQPIVVAARILAVPVAEREPESGALVPSLGPGCELKRSATPGTCDAIVLAATFVFLFRIANYKGACISARD